MSLSYRCFSLSHSPSLSVSTINKQSSGEEGEKKQTGHMAAVTLCDPMASSGLPLLLARLLRVRVSGAPGGLATRQVRL